VPGSRKELQKSLNEKTVVQIAYKLLIRRAGRHGVTDGDYLQWTS
jgi:hypothetical protein